MSIKYLDMSPTPFSKKQIFVFLIRIINSDFVAYHPYCMQLTNLTAPNIFGQRVTVISTISPPDIFSIFLRIYPVILLILLSFLFPNVLSMFLLLEASPPFPKIY